MGGTENKHNWHNFKIKQEITESQNQYLFQFLTISVMQSFFKTFGKHIRQYME